MHLMSTPFLRNAINQTAHTQTHICENSEKYFLALQDRHQQFKQKHFGFWNYPLKMYKRPIKLKAAADDGQRNKKRNDLHKKKYEYQWCWHVYNAWTPLIHVIKKKTRWNYMRMRTGECKKKQRVFNAGSKPMMPTIKKPYKRKDHTSNENIANDRKKNAAILF